VVHPQLDRALLFPPATDRDLGIIVNVEG
jgi:hypothetical protein